MYCREHELVTTIWCVLIMGPIIINIVIRVCHGPAETGNPTENDGKYFNNIAKSLPKSL